MAPSLIWRGVARKKQQAHCKMMARHGCCGCRGQRDTTEKPKTPAVAKPRPFLEQQQQQQQQQPPAAAAAAAVRPGEAAAAGVPAFGGRGAGGLPQPKRLRPEEKECQNPSP